MYRQDEEEGFLGGLLSGVLGLGEAEGEGEYEGEMFEEQIGAAASELLEVSTEGELDHFLGDFLKKAAGTAKRFIASPVGKTLLGAAKSAAVQALPSIGKAIGGAISPGSGAAVGAQIGDIAAQMLSKEGELMSPRDHEFTVAKRLLKAASTAAKTLASTPSGAAPAEAVRTALLKGLQAAKQSEEEGFLGALLPIATKALPVAANLLGGLLGEEEAEAEADELLNVASEEEVEQFLGNLFKKAVSGVKRFAGSSVGQALIGVAKDVAKQALPSVGQAIAGDVGGKLASVAAQALEGEMDMAKRFVKLAHLAAQKAAQAPRGAHPEAVAKAAFSAAARSIATGQTQELGSLATRLIPVARKIGTKVIAPTAFGVGTGVGGNLVTDVLKKQGYWPVK